MAHLKLLGQDVHQAQAGSVRLLQVGGGFGFAGTQHVGILLGIGVQTQVGDAEVAVQQVAGLNHLPLGPLRKGALLVEAFRVGPLHVDGGVKPGVEAQLVDAVAVPPHHFLGGGDARLDHRFGKSLRQ